MGKHFHPKKPLTDMWNPDLDPNEVIEIITCDGIIVKGKCQEYELYLRNLDGQRRD
jgi:hypothetical protein